MAFGRIRLSAALLLFTVAWFVLAPCAFAEQRVALVIGNSHYQHIRPLANPANDARLMADTLRRAGFALIGNRAQLDLSKSDMERAIQDFGRRLGNDVVGVFYFAGHGLQIQGENFLAPVTANSSSEADADYELVNVNLVIKQMAIAHNPLNIVILDACRNNPFVGRGFRDTSSGLVQMQAPRGTLVAFATQPGGVAADGTGTNSPFTKSLAAKIETQGLDLLSLFNQVAVDVDKITNHSQQPWMSLSPIDGRFSFRPDGTKLTANLLSSPTTGSDLAGVEAKRTPIISGSERTKATSNEVTQSPLAEIPLCPAPGTVALRDYGEVVTYVQTTSDDPELCEAKLKLTGRSGASIGLVLGINGWNKYQIDLALQNWRRFRESPINTEISWRIDSAGEESIVAVGTEKLKIGNQLRTAVEIRTTYIFTNSARTTRWYWVDIETGIPLQYRVFYGGGVQPTFSTPDYKVVEIRVPTN